MKTLLQGPGARRLRCSDRARGLVPAEAIVEEDVEAELPGPETNVLGRFKSALRATQKETDKTYLRWETLRPLNCPAPGGPGR
jgi:hypothetical protein